MGVRGLQERHRQVDEGPRLLVVSAQMTSWIQGRIGMMRHGPL